MPSSNIFSEIINFNLHLFINTAFGCRASPMHVVSAYNKHQTAVVFAHMLNYLSKVLRVTLLFCPDQSNIEIVCVFRFLRMRCLVTPCTWKIPIEFGPFWPLKLDDFHDFLLSSSIDWCTQLNSSLKMVADTEILCIRLKMNLDWWGIDLSSLITKKLNHI